MKRETYNNFFNEIKTELNNFLFKYDVSFECKFAQDKNDDLQYTVNLGETFGKVNILFETYDNLPKNERESGTFTICMRYHNPKCPKNAFKRGFKQLLNEDGTFILFSSESGLESLKNDFREILNIWSKDQKEKMSNILDMVCLS